MQLSQISLNHSRANPININTDRLDLEASSIVVELVIYKLHVIVRIPFLVIFLQFGSFFCIDLGILLSKIRIHIVCLSYDRFGCHSLRSREGA